MCVFTLGACTEKSTSVPDSGAEARAAIATKAAGEFELDLTTVALDAPGRFTAETAPKKDDFARVLEAKFGPAGKVYDESGEHPATWDSQVAGSPETTMYVHVTPDGVLHLGIVDQTDVATIYSGKWPSLAVSRLVAFALPTRRDEFVACLAEDCTLPGHCLNAHAQQRARQCVWVAPNCEGAPGAVLSPRFGRVDHKAKSLLAEVYGEQPLCLPTDSTEPKWSADSPPAHSFGPEWVLRAELAVPGCAPPTWQRLTEVLAWNTEARQHRAVGLSTLPRCLPDGSAPPKSAQAAQ
jgi:hypothetical protein